MGGLPKVYLTPPSLSAGNAHVVEPLVRTRKDSGSSQGA
jgi:hypothetical protein